MSRQTAFSSSSSNAGGRVPVNLSDVRYPTTVEASIVPEGFTDSLENVMLFYVKRHAPSRAVYGAYSTVTLADDLERLVAAIVDYNKRRQCDFNHGRSGDSEFISSKTDCEWLNLAYESMEDMKISQVGDLIASISRQLKNSNFQQIDNNLATADTSKMSIDAVVAISRTTYVVRSSLGHWKDFVGRARKEMQVRGEPGPYLPGL